MKIFRDILLYTMALGMTIAGIFHFLHPQTYLRIVPDWLPLRLIIVYVSGVFEIITGIGLVMSKFRGGAALLLLSLMAIFLPLHIWDCFRPQPALGSTLAAVIRLLLQFLLIWSAWWLLQTQSSSGGDSA